MKGSASQAELSGFFAHHGRFPWEGQPQHSLWLAAEALDALQAAVPAAFPGRLRELRQYDVRSPNAVSGSVLWADVTLVDDLLEFRIETHEAGFVHEVALRVLAAGHGGLVLDQEHLWSQPLAPYLALTEYRPGETPTTRVLDPLREAPTELETMRRWLARYTGAQPSGDGWGLGARPPTEQRWERLGLWLLQEHGQLLPAPRFQPKGAR